MDSANKYKIKKIDEEIAGIEASIKDITNILAFTKDLKSSEIFFMKKDLGMLTKKKNRLLRTRRRLHDN